MNLTQRLKKLAHELGFPLVGACPAVEPTGLSRLYEWLEMGYAGEMHYLARRREAYSHPRHVLAGARSLLMVGMHYEPRPVDDRACVSPYGKVASYAWGERDYHDVIHERLKQLVAFIQQEVPGSQARGVVDSAPLLEREFAQLAGLGWRAKNTLLINPRVGSWFFLAAVLTDLELEYDEPFAKDHCGSCRACLDACPTEAFPQPYLLDARRCLSYLTIELRDQIPQSLRAGVSDWVFGCDLCQQVCPWNRHAPSDVEGEFRARDDLRYLDLPRLFYLTDAEFRELFRATPLWRAKRRGLLRNAAIVLGNQKSPDAIEALTRGLGDNEPLIRDACAWALGEIKGA